MSDYSRSDTSKKKKQKKLKAKKDEDSEDAPETESSDEELDLTKDCHPIAYYMNDRAEMISQMFSVIKGKKLKAMLPPILRDYDIEKLKLQCLDQLLGMSEKRINCILEGEILETSSESDVESKESSDSSSSEEEEKASKHSSNQRGMKRKSDTESIERSSKISKTDEAQPVEQGKTLLEILELEMRARAIRALLKQGGETEQVKTPEEAPNGDIVDLTVDEEEFPTVIKTEPQSTEQELSFEEKVVKSVEPDKKEKAVEKKKKLIAEIELRNKLIKKKSYRTKQQRIDNLGEEIVDSQEDVEKSNEIAKEILPDAIIKEEPKEILIEDAEEGEVSSEDEPPVPVIVKEEKPESPESLGSEDKPIDGERIMAMDNGQFVSDKNLSLEREEEIDVIPVESSHPETIELNEEESQTSDKQKVTDEDSGTSNEKDDVSQPEKQNSDADNLSQEDTTWRERWLRNDDVQKVVKSSKICGLVKKRIAKKKQIMEAEEKLVAISEPPVSVTPPIDIVEGSVREYETLPGKVTEDGDNTNPGVLQESERDTENLNDEKLSDIPENG